jgi:hypothetical protein
MFVTKNICAIQWMRMSQLAEACSTHGRNENCIARTANRGSVDPIHQERNDVSDCSIAWFNNDVVVLYFTHMQNGEAALVSKHHVTNALREARRCSSHCILHTIGDSCSNKHVCWLCIEVDCGSDVTHLIRHVLKVCEEWWPSRVRGTTALQLYPQSTAISCHTFQLSSKVRESRLWLFGVFRPFRRFDTCLLFFHWDVLVGRQCY